jgi:very-short-patch-repair endonuclease
LEHQLRELLKQSGLEFQEQVRFGRYVVDAWVPELGLVFEADGQFWYHHQDKDREARRDGYLVERGVTAVIHLDDDDLAQFKPIVEE